MAFVHVADHPADQRMGGDEARRIAGRGVDVGRQRLAHEVEVGCTVASKCRRWAWRGRLPRGILGQLLPRAAQHRARVQRVDIVVEQQAVRLDE
jgi:hypothetical protein